MVTTIRPTNAIRVFACHGLAQNCPTAIARPSKQRLHTSHRPVAPVAGGRVNKGSWLDSTSHGSGSAAPQYKQFQVEAFNIHVDLLQQDKYSCAPQHCQAY
jgi:hypothetical protein